MKSKYIHRNKLTTMLYHFHTTEKFKEYLSSESLYIYVTTVRNVFYQQECARFFLFKRQKMKTTDVFRASYYLNDRVV